MEPDTFKKTIGEIEAEISNALVQFQKDYMGRGPVEIKTYIVEDMVFVRLKKILTRAEQQLAKTRDGVELIKKVRVSLLEKAKDTLYQTIKGITNAEVIGLHADVSTKRAEMVIIFIMAENIEKKLR
ncbi:MAG: DUF2294 domain-containing protein [Deltaproteobacteria bacterium]|nr:DUF2294 domain-containing protein [Deltaproteobacteria bacterium]